MMTPQEYAEAQSRLLHRSRCIQEHRIELAVVQAESVREIARLEQSIADDQRQLASIAAEVDAHWRDVFHLPEVSA